MCCSTSIESAGGRTDGTLAASQVQPRGTEVDLLACSSTEHFSTSNPSSFTTTTNMTASNDAAEAGPSTTKPAITRNKKGKLIRPRGKRGGKKNRRPSATPAAKAAAKGAASSSSSSASRTQHSLRIAHFHRLEKEKARLLSAREEDADDAARATRLAEIEAEQEALGGLDAYQDDSLTGSASHRGGESGKWLAQQMIKQLGGKQEVRHLRQIPDYLRSISHAPSHPRSSSSTS